ncbi:MAG: hypothetical protein ACK5O7_05515 [Holosporales bacterium]
MTRFFHKYGVHILIGFFAGLTVMAFWPGILREDSLTQYQQALQGAYSDHHPPIMAAYWRLLNHLYPGPGLLFLSHMACLWLSAALMAHAYKGTPQRWLFTFIPLIPQVLGYGLFVLKDAGFALSFLLASSFLILAGRQQRRLSPVELGIICVLLFYGAAVKYQGIFVLPFMCLWIALNYLQHRTLKVRWAGGMAFYGIFFAAITFFNAATTQQQNHSWQYVKLYDLAAISLEQNQALFPDFVKAHPRFSLQALHDHFNPRRVDEYVFIPQPILIKGQTEEQRQELWDYWWQTVRRYPKSYLKHRIRLLGFMLTNSPLKTPDEIQSDRATIPPALLQMLQVLDHTGILGVLKTLTSFLLFAPLMLFYLLFGLKNLRHDPCHDARSLVMLNGMGLALLTTLTFFSMASDVRYIYLTMCCCHFSHPVFWHLWRNKKRKR